MVNLILNKIIIFYTKSVYIPSKLKCYKFKVSFNLIYAFFFYNLSLINTTNLSQKIKKKI